MSADGTLPAWAGRLIALRLARNWVAADLAEALKKLRSDLPAIKSLTHMIRSDWESGKHRPGPRYQLLLAAVYDTDAAAIFGGAMQANRSREDTDDVERRRLLQALAALGIGASPVADALKVIRERVDHTLGADGPRQIAHWEEVAAEYGYEFLTKPAVELRPDLAADLIALQYVLDIATDEEHWRALCRPVGQMAMLMALTIGSLGNRREARHWWQTARRSADASTDIDLRVWVRGYEAMQALYERRPPEIVLRRAEEAITIAKGVPRAAVLEAMAARSQMFAMLGRARQAQDGVHAMERLFSALPASSAHDRLSTRSWPETGLRHTQAWVFTHTGHPQAPAAQEAALDLYPPEMVRQAAQIKLLQASSLVRGGDIGDGIEHARHTLDGLPPEQRTIGVQRGAQTILALVPEVERTRPAVVEYGERLAFPARDNGPRP